MDKAWEKFCLTRKNADWETYRQLTNISKTQVQNAKLNYYEECLSDNFKNPKQFWSKIKNMLLTSDKYFASCSYNIE